MGVSMAKNNLVRIPPSEVPKEFFALAEYIRRGLVRENQSRFYENKETGAVFTDMGIRLITNRKTKKVALYREVNGVVFHMQVPNMISRHSEMLQFARCVEALVHYNHGGKPGGIGW